MRFAPLKKCLRWYRQNTQDSHAKFKRNAATALDTVRTFGRTTTDRKIVTEQNTITIARKVITNKE